MRKGNIVLIILGLAIIVGIVIAILVKPPEIKDRYGEIGRRKTGQESHAASPSATPTQSPATPSASPLR